MGTPRRSEIHFMGKLHKIEAFVALNKVMCGGMETRAVQLIILFPLRSLCISLYNLVYVFGYQEGK